MIAVAPAGGSASRQAPEALSLPVTRSTCHSTERSSRLSATSCWVSITMRKWSGVATAWVWVVARSARASLPPVTSETTANAPSGSVGIVVSAPSGAAEPEELVASGLADDASGSGSGETVLVHPDIMAAVSRTDATSPRDMAETLEHPGGDAGRMSRIEDR